MSNRPVALITGGAKRIGAAIARRMAKEGFDIVITYLSSGNAAEELMREIEASGGRMIVFGGDVKNADKWIDEIVGQVECEFGRLDLLVNNASIYRPSNLANTDEKIVQEMMAVHFYGPLVICRGFEKMLRKSRGAIVNMVDATVEKPGGNYLAYSASKAALANLTLALAKEFAPDVTVNGIAPGVVEWPADFPEKQKEEYLKRVPLNRSGTPEDVAELAAFLATNGKYITGQILKLDGGRSIV